VQPGVLLTIPYYTKAFCHKELFDPKLSIVPRLRNSDTKEFEDLGNKKACVSLSWQVTHVHLTVSHRVAHFPFQAN
jgi:hypothetical protein